MRLLASPGGRILALSLCVILPLAVLSGCSSTDPAKPDNNAPVITNVAVNPSSVQPGGSTQVTVTATDEDGDTLTYSYTVLHGTITGTGASVIWSGLTEPGVHIVSVTVNDGEGGQATNVGAVTVVGSTDTKIIGTVAFPIGVPGNLANGVVSIYANYDDWNNYAPALSVVVQGTGTSVTYEMTNVPAGSWYIDYWLDNDFNQFWSTGDYIAWYGSGVWGAVVLTPFTIAEGQTVTRNMTAVVIP